MNTPIRRMLDGYIAQGRVRMHMPGHKGILPAPLSEAAAYDITEVQGADSLFASDGVIRACEEGFASLYGARESLLSCGGSTLCIQAMLALTARPGEKVLFYRNIHRAALNAMILLDIRPVWLYPPEETEGFGRAEPAQVCRALAADPEIRGVYLTSPDYYGGMHDVAAIAEICRRFDVPLLIDNAHGAHLKFLEEDRHPISLGADLCCDSLHKTLPALTGSAVLHLGSGRFTRERAKEAMGLFGSTSPSYLMMLSMDMLLSDPGALRAEVRRTVGRCERIRRVLRHRGFLVTGDDPMKLSFRAPGRTGLQCADDLRRAGIEPEYADGKWVVLMPSMNTPDEDFIRLEEALLRYPAAPARPAPPQAAQANEPDTRAARPDDGGPPARPAPPQMVPREAYFAPSEHIHTVDAEGRIYADISWPCPPAIPIIMPGERIDKKVCEFFLASGKTVIKVVQ